MEVRPFYAILVMLLDGSQGYVRKAGKVARFPSIYQAEYWRVFRLEGIAESIREIKIVEFS